MQIRNQLTTLLTELKNVLPSKKQLEDRVSKLEQEIKELWQRINILDSRTIKEVRLGNPYDLNEVGKLRK